MKPRPRKNSKRQQESTAPTTPPAIAPAAAPFSAATNGPAAKNGPRTGGIDILFRVLPILSILISGWVWYDNAYRWDLLNNERISIPDTKFMPALTVPVHNKDAIPEQGISSLRYLTYDGETGAAEVKLYSYFTFWDKRTKKMLLPDGIFVYLNEAKAKRTTLARDLNAQEADIEIRHARRIASQIRNVGKLPAYELRWWYNCYAKGNDDWFKLFDDSLVRRFANSRDVLDPDEEFWTNFEVGGFSLDTKYPDDLLIRWTLEYKDTKGETKSVEFFRLFGYNRVTSEPIWRAPTSKEVQQITNNAKQLGPQNIFNLPAITERP